MLFDKLTQNAYDAVIWSQDRCQKLGYREVTTLDILSALINQKTGIITQVIQAAKITSENIRLEAEKIDTRIVGFCSQPGFSAATSEVFEFASQESEKLNDIEIDTHHLLLGLLRQTEGAAIKVLQSLEVDCNQLRTQILLKLVEQGHPNASQHLPSQYNTSFYSNGTNQIKVHLNLIQQILLYPEGSDAKFVMAYPGTISPDLIEGVALILQQQGDTKGAEILKKLINLVSDEETDTNEIPTPVCTPTVQEEFKPTDNDNVPTREDSPVQEEVEPIINVQSPIRKQIQEFLFKLLRLTLECNGDEQVIYSFLKINSDGLNSQFCEILQDWATNTFSGIDDSEKYNLAKRIVKISSLIRNFDTGNTLVNLEIALTGYQLVTPILTKAKYPQDWAIVQNCLGLIYLELVQVNPEENLKQSIDCFTAALGFYKQEQFPEERKIILNNLKQATQHLNNLLKQEQPEIMPQNSERNQAYLYLIQELLRSSQSQYQTILDDNSELLDSGLIQMMREMAEAEKSRGNIQNTELLIAITEQLTETLSVCSSTSYAQSSSTSYAQIKKIDDELETIDTLIISSSEEEERQQAYRNLIDDVMRSPNQAPVILMSNFNLLDASLVQMIEKLAAEYSEQNEQETAEFLQNLANGVTNLFNNADLVQQREQFITDAANLGIHNPTAYLGNLNTQMLTAIQNLSLSASPEEYFNFLGVLLNVMADSQFNSQLVYPILQANVEKLDDNLATLLPEFFSIFQTEESPELAKGMAGGCILFSNLLMDFPLGNKAINIEIAINCYGVATTVFTREGFSEQWAAIQNNLGIAYCQRIRGDRADNLEEAISYYQNALQVRVCERFSSEWAETQSNLGLAYLQRIRGDRADNLELAIQSIQASLTVYNRSTFPEKWGMAQSNLGDVYRNRIRGDRAENIERAIESFEAALSVEHSPNMWATIQNNLGVAYLERIRGERSENLEQAFRYFEATLTVYTPSTFPFEWARTQSNLASAYFYRIHGIKAENLEQGFQASQATLNIYTLEHFPEQWALTLLNLSNIYVDRIRGQKADNIEQAIQACQSAFTVLTYTSFPQKWAECQLTMGNAYSQRILGKVADNWEQAIQAYEAALTVLTYDSFPEMWGGIQHNLSRAYMNRIRGEKSDNLEKAVQFGEAALTVRTHNGNPEKWAESQDNLARVYSERIRGEKAYNLERGIQACKAALDVYTPASFPEQWAMLQNLLGDLYIERIQGEKAENIDLAIEALVAAGNIYTRDNFPEQWANNHHSLSTAYRERIRGERADNLERSLKDCEAALTIYTRENFPQRWAGSQINRGLAYWRRLRGDHADNMEQAIGSCEAALTVYNREDFPSDWALTQVNLAAMFFERTLGDVAENLDLSIQAGESALTIYTQDAFPFNWGQIQSNLSNAYRLRINGDRNENVKKSIQACEAAFAVHKRETSPYHWANTKLSLGNTYTISFIGDREENLEKAIIAYSDALTIFTEQNFPQQWAMIQNNIGDLYRQRIRGEEADNFEIAIGYFKNALNVSEFTCDPYEYAKTLFNLGFIYLKARQLDLAYESLVSCIETVESVRSEIISGEQAKRKNSEQSFMFSQLMVKVCLELAESRQDSKYYAKALEYVERNKARNLVELLSNRDILPKANVSEEILKELKRLRQEIATEQRRLDNYRNKESIISNQNHPELNISDIAIIPDRTQINQLQQQLDDLIKRDIQSKDPNFSATQKVKPILFSEIKALLSDNKTVIIEWFFPIPFYQSSNLPPIDKYDPDIIGTKLYTFITTSESEYPIVLSSSLKNYEDLLTWNTEYWQAYSKDHQKTLWQDQLEERLKRLAEILDIDNIIGHITQKYERVILIPHWYLHLFPLHALPLSNGDCLLDRFPAGVSYAPNCQLLKISPNQKHQDLSQFFAIQNPTDAGENLPYTDIEVEIIRKNFQSQNYVFAKEAATRQAIDSQSFTSANCIHFSCHGYFSFSNPLESALILAGASKMDTPFNLKKCLTLGEIFELNLSKCWLVSLSACETGIIDPTTSHVEYTGLPSGFLYAGASYVVSSLWTVNDLSTAFLMINLYQELFSQEGEKNVIKALKKAQLWLRDITKSELQAWIKANSMNLDGTPKSNLNRKLHKLSDDDQPFKEPYYWAAFYVIGK